MNQSTVAAMNEERRAYQRAARRRNTVVRKGRSAPAYAYPLGIVGGRMAYRFPVFIERESLGRTLRRVVERVHVTAYTAAGANYVSTEVREQMSAENVHPVSINAYGPHGGRVGRYVGWESATFAVMCNRGLGARKQLNLFDGRDFA